MALLSLSTQRTLLAATFVSMGLSIGGCSHHATGEGKPTEEIALEQGEIARANNPVPAAKEKASPASVFAAPVATATTTASAPAASGGADAGEKLYAAVCKTCHDAALMGAPKFADKAAWAPRIAQGKDTLYKHAIEGFQGKNGVMPPKGGSTASDDEIKAAVDYMVSKAS